MRAWIDNQKGVGYMVLEAVSETKYMDYSPYNNN
jgi:hypothetical protein